VILGALSAKARRELEELMLTRPREYTSDFARKYFGDGKAEGKAEGIVEGERDSLRVVLRARRFRITDDVDRRIRDCSDADVLRRWIERAVRARKLEDVFS